MPLDPAAVQLVLRLTAGATQVALPARLEGPSGVAVTLAPPPAPFATSPLVLAAAPATQAISLETFPTGDVSVELSVDGGRTFTSPPTIAKVAKK